MYFAYAFNINLCLEEVSFGKVVTNGFGKMIHPVITWLHQISAPPLVRPPDFGADTL